MTKGMHKKEGFIYLLAPDGTSIMVRMAQQLAGAGLKLTDSITRDSGKQGMIWRWDRV